MSAEAWSNMLLDNQLATDMDGLTKPIDNRGVEAYRTQDNKLTMKSDNAKNRKKQRVRPYQIKKEENKKSKSKKVNNNQQEGKKNDVPEIAYGVKRELKVKNQITEFHDTEQVAEEIRFRLWERKRHMIRDLVVIVGKALCIEVVDQVAKIEIEGGIQRHNNGRKTPGGVFISLLKERTDVDQIELAKVLEQHAPKPWANATRQKKLRQSEKVASSSAGDVADDVKREATTAFKSDLITESNETAEPEPQALDKAMFFSPEAHLY